MSESSTTIKSQRQHRDSGSDYITNKMKTYRVKDDRSIPVVE